MKKCIAIPMKGEILCGHFGHCDYFSIVEIENNQIQTIHQATPPDHQPGVYPRWIASLGVTAVIASGIGQKAIEMFERQNIEVIVGAPTIGDRQLVEQFLQKELSLHLNACNHGEKEEHSCNH